MVIFLVCTQLFSDSCHSPRTLQSYSLPRDNQSKHKYLNLQFLWSPPKFLKIMHDYHPELWHTETLPWGHTGKRHWAPIHTTSATCTHWLQQSSCLSNRSSFTFPFSKQRAWSSFLVLFSKSIPISKSESHSFCLIYPNLYPPRAH